MDEEDGVVMALRRPLTGARIETPNLAGAERGGKSPPHGGAD